MRVCVLAQASPCTWVAHYAAAFRACCETLVVGPAPDSETLKAWDHRDKAAHLIAPNDVTCDFEAQEIDLLGLLPQGWTPDLVVGIAGLGGDPLYRHAARLTCPTVFLSIDTWQCLLDYRQALGYDFVFAAQREFVGHLRATGSRHVFWLPLACDPEVHHPVDTVATHDIGFAGSVSAPVHAERKRLIEALGRRFTVRSAESVFGDDMCELFARCRLAFNYSAVQELNMRIFEVLAMGRLLLTNREASVNGLEDLFEDGKHLVVYHSENDLLEKAAAYLADDASRRAVADAGRAEVRAKHTYAHRVQTILETVRDYAPPCDFRTTATAYHGERLEDYLPTIPGAVVDVGLASEASKVALRRRGVTRFEGVAVSPGDAEKRQGSYDAMAVWPGKWPAGVDTAVVGELTVLPCSLDDVLARVHAILHPGGTLVLRLRGNELDAAGLKPDAAILSAWLESHDFHLRLVETGLAGGGVLLARKRTRRLADVAAEVLGRLNVPGLDLDGLLRRIPPAW